MPRLQIKFNYDVVQTRVGANDQPEDPEQDQEGILEDHQSESPATVAVPIGERVNESWEGHPKRGKTQRAEERDEQIQLWHCDRQKNCHKRRTH